MVEVPTIYLIKAIFTPMMKFFSLEACVWNFTHSHKNKKNEFYKRFLNQIWCGLSVCRRKQIRAASFVGAAVVVVVYDCNLKSIDCIEHIRTQSQLIHFISFCLAVFHFFFLLLFSHGKRFRTFKICTERRSGIKC